MLIILVPLLCFPLSPLSSPLSPPSLPPRGPVARRWWLPSWRGNSSWPRLRSTSTTSWWTPSSRRGWEGRGAPWNAGARPYRRMGLALLCHVERVLCISKGLGAVFPWETQNVSGAPPPPPALPALSSGAGVGLVYHFPQTLYIFHVAERPVVLKIPHTMKYVECIMPVYLLPRGSTGH